MKFNRGYRLIPIIIAVSVVLGVFIGNFYFRRSSGKQRGVFNTNSNKINALLRIVEEQYVDTIDMNTIVEDVLPNILAELDPHSMYIPAKNLEAVNSELEASFSGIGVAFTIQNDTIHINSVIQGGPSEKVGLLPGDRIVTVNDSLFVGDKVDNEIAMSTLKGPKGTEVKVGVKRRSEEELLHFNIVRDDIPQQTINATYMINNDWGYIQITKFGQTTYIELLSSIAKLNHQKSKGLIIDLRGNTGGFMEPAIRAANEFLEQGRLIVYADGRKFPRMDEFADGTGSCQRVPLVVLVDEGSASASEIFAGAIQDNDRGFVVGRRTFGKGLVQQPIAFSDGSGLRLTVARYYTPAGRSIQRPYESGKNMEYQMDILSRFQHGEFFSKDSIKFDESQIFHTTKGRPVYGGGGIMPDFFIPQDTIGASSYLTEVLKNGLTIEFSFLYSDQNRTKLSEFKDFQSLATYLKNQRVLQNFIAFADEKGVQRRNILIQRSYKLLEKNLYGNIIYNILGVEEFVKFFNQDDSAVKKAVSILESGDAFPQAAELSDEDKSIDDNSNDESKKSEKKAA